MQTRFTYFSSYYQIVSRTFSNTKRGEMKETLGYQLCLYRSMVQCSAFQTFLTGGSLVAIGLGPPLEHQSYYHVQHQSIRAVIMGITRILQLLGFGGSLGSYCSQFGNYWSKGWLSVVFFLEHQQCRIDSFASQSPLQSGSKNDGHALTAGSQQSLP